MKKYLLGLFAMALAVGFSSFTKSEVKARPLATIYFLYSPTTYTETLFETAASWAVTTGPTNSACPGTVNPCTVAINDADVPHIPGNTTEQDFAAKLATITASTPYLGFTSAVGFAYGAKTDSKN